MDNLACCSSSATERERESAWLLCGSRSSVVRVSTAKAGGLWFDSQWLPRNLFSHFVSMLILPPVAYPQFLPPVGNQYSYKK